MFQVRIFVNFYLNKSYLFHYSEEIEELQQIISNLSQQLNQANKLRNDHGIKLVKLIDKGKEYKN